MHLCDVHANDFTHLTFFSQSVPVMREQTRMTLNVLRSQVLCQDQGGNSFFFQFKLHTKPLVSPNNYHGFGTSVRHFIRFSLRYFEIRLEPVFQLP